MEPDDILTELVVWEKDGSIATVGAEQMLNMSLPAWPWPGLAWLWTIPILQWETGLCTKFRLVCTWACSI